jgi:hypothetical protein
MITKLIDWSGHPTKGKPENLLSRYGIYAGLDVGRFVHPSLGRDRAPRTRGRGNPT